MIQFKNTIDPLINRYLSQECSEAEYLTLQEWLAQSSKNKDYFERYKLVYNGKKLHAIEADVEKSWSRLYKKLEEVEPERRPKGKVNLLSYLPYAAAILLLFSLGLNLFLGLSVGGNTADTLAYTEFTMPAGSKPAKLVLSDGSTVFLNSSSKLTYPVAFNGKTREVTLQGEAFFDIAPDADKPFIVSFCNHKVEVLGTTFNIESYKELDYIKTTLFTGSIDISSTANGNEFKERLQPTQTCIYNKTTKKHQIIAGANLSVVNSWRNNIYKFKDATLKEICTKLGIHYAADIELSSQLHNELYTGSIALDKPLLVALQLLNYKQEFTIRSIDESTYKLTN